MGIWKIAKQFDFDYGHRVWNQTLDIKYSVDDRCVCRHLHGHRGTLLIYLESNELKDGVVLDFKHLNFFKKWLDDVIDHKFILDINDPLFHKLLPDVGNYRPVMYKHSRFFNWFSEKYWTVLPADITKEEKELYEGMIIVPFVPTSENLSKWFFKIVEEKMKKLNIKVSKVQFFETPKSQSIYEE